MFIFISLYLLEAKTSVQIFQWTKFFTIYVPNLRNLIRIGQSYGQLKIQKYSYEHYGNYTAFEAI